MTRLTPAQRSLSARAAAHTRWAHTSDTERARFAADARARQLSRWDREVDPDGELDPAERARRADSAMRAHMARMGKRSSQRRTNT
jgi:hypothetical protein